MSQDELLLADELEALLATHVGAPGGPASPALSVLPRADAALAIDLFELARAIRPDPTFVDALEAELRAQAAAPRPIPAIHASEGERSRTLRRRIQGPMSRLPRRWPAWAAALLLLIALLFVPPVQATVQAVIQIGVDHIFRTPPARTPTSRTPTPTPLASVLDLAGETTLAQAQKQVTFPIRLPAYPPDLGPPQRVFVQDLDGAAVVLVWLDPQHPGTVRMSLHELSEGALVYKTAPPAIQETTVHGQHAIWTDGPYIVQVVVDGQTEDAPRRLVTGHVLIWMEGDITYRLETSVSLDEAVRIAESLH